MTFITPKTWSVGEVLSAVDMNLYVRDNTAELNEGYRLAGRRFIETTTAFAIDDAYGDGSDTSWIRAVRAQLVGGGGGGGGSDTGGEVGGGGGAGAFADFWTTDMSLLSSLTITVGDKGIARIGLSGTNGTASSLGSLVVAAGGSAGVLGSNSQAADMRIGPGGNGGGNAASTIVQTATTSSIVIRGQAGDNGLSIITSSDATGIRVGGYGGSSPFGGGGIGGRSKVGSPAQNGSPGNGHGSGGGGAVLDADAGDGADGLVVLYFYR